MKAAVVAVCSAFLLFCSGSAGAQTTAPGNAFGSVGGEVALGAASALSLATVFLPQQKSAWAPWRSWSTDLRYDEWSDVLGAMGSFVWVSATTYAIEGAHLDASGVDEPFARALRTPLMHTEALFFATSVTYALKRTTGRCRPRAFVAGICKGGEYDAFPSGHTMTVSAIAGVELSLLLRNEGHSAPRATAFALSEVVALSAGLLRVLAGAHSPEDVVAGFVVGNGAGLAVGYAHPMAAVGAPKEATGATPMTLTWQGAF